MIHRVRNMAARYRQNLTPMRPDHSGRIRRSSLGNIASNRLKRFRPYRRLASCSHGTPRSALLCQGCVNRPFKLLKQSQGFRIGKRQELHQNDSAYASVEIDPEIGISQARPGETSGTASTGQWFGRDHKTKPPLLDHAGKEFRVVRQVRDYGFQRLYVEVADRIRGHQSHGLGLEYRAPIGTAFIQEDALEGKIIGCRTIEPAAAHLEFRLLRHLELCWSKRAIRTSRVHTS